MFKVIIGIEGNSHAINKLRGMLKVEQETHHGKVLLLKGYTTGFPYKLIQPIPASCLLLVLSDNKNVPSELLYCEHKDGRTIGWESLESDYFIDKDGSKLYRSKLEEYSALLPNNNTSYIDSLGSFIYEIDLKKSRKEIENLLDFIILDV